MSRNQNSCLTLNVERLENRLLLAAEVFDLSPGTSSSSPGFVGSIGDDLIVTLRRDGIGRELYLVDDSRSVTLLRDINPGSADSNAFPVAQLSDRVIFQVDRSGREELWSTDGTSAGTQYLGTTWRFTNDKFVVNDHLYALIRNNSRYEVIVSDGTRAGTEVVAHVTDHTPELMTGGSEVYLWLASGDLRGSNPPDARVRVWSIGESASTTRVLVDEMAYSSWAGVTGDGTLYYRYGEFEVGFDEYSGYYPIDLTNELYRSVAGGTPRRVPVDVPSRSFVNGDELILFGQIGDDISSIGTYRLDGNNLELITRETADFYSIGGRLVYVENASHQNQHGNSFIKAIDGRTVKTIHTEVFNSISVDRYTENHLYFTNQTGTTWRTDGTSEGTEIFYRRREAERIDRLYEDSDGTVYFETHDYKGDREVFKSDGSLVTEQLIFLPEKESDEYTSPAIAGFHQGRAVLIGSTADHGKELYLEDTPLSVEEGGILEINGTSAADDVSIIRLGNDYLVNVNGVQSTYSHLRQARINSRGGNDKIRVAVQSVIIAGSGDDFIIGSPFDDVILTGSGADTVFGMAGDDFIRGASGNDRLYGISGGNLIDGGTGNDNVFGGSGFDQISGGIGNDTLLGLGGSDKISAGQGDDFASGGTGDDTILGGTGDDRLFGNVGNDTILGNDGKDLLFGVEGADELFGGDGNDELYGMGGVDRLHGEQGNDLLIGHGSIDTLVGGFGDDRLIGGDGADNLYGDSDYLQTAEEGGNDQIFGGGGDDEIRGGGGDDRLVGNSGLDEIYGDDGSDTIYGDEDRDRLHGGEGPDNVFGGTGDDYVSGQNGHDMLYGEEGDDFVKGGFGNDRMEGGAGDDNLVGDSGIDTIYGGLGNDSIRGDLGNNKLFGDEGDDVIVGSHGHDQLDGGAGDDLLIGGRGNDTLRGSIGDDVLVGGWDIDKLYGGDGSDIIFSAGPAVTNYAYDLEPLRTDWSQNIPYFTRRNRLRNGTSPNYQRVLGGINDVSADQVFGGEGKDWLFALTSEVRDRNGDDIESIL